MKLLYTRVSRPPAYRPNLMVLSLTAFHLSEYGFLSLRIPPNLCDGEQTTRPAFRTQSGYAHWDVCSPEMRLPFARLTNETPWPWIRLSGSKPSKHLIHTYFISHELHPAPSSQVFLNVCPLYSLRCSCSAFVVDGHFQPSRSNYVIIAKREITVANGMSMREFTCTLLSPDVWECTVLCFLLRGDQR